jgi:YbgC/YbaW family acyl-CoA thioester hydrolase
MCDDDPYVVHRRVRWGDCDAGGIVYTPNFLDYAVEAAESWFEAVTGMHWSRLAPELNIGHPYVHCALEFSRMLRCDELFDMTVRVEAVRRSSYVLQVIGTNAAGETCFLARLVAAFISLEPIGARPIPERFRASIEKYGSAA